MQSNLRHVKKIKNCESRILTEALQKYRGCLTDDAFPSEESPNTGERTRHHNQSNPTTLTATLITYANISISMRQTVKNVSPLTLKLAFRVRNKLCEDFALILNRIILRLVLLDRAAFPALDASTKERESSSVCDTYNIGKCALLGVACMLFRARRKSKNESRAFSTRADARARVPRAERGPQASPKGPRCILRGSVSWATVAVAAAAVVTIAPPRYVAAITAFFASHFYIWPATNIYCRDEESSAAFVQVEEAAGQSQ
ncbi:hypothetical protein ALC56_02275 [Trachymyrmex septentrionalis]|uniref:Uncharacterized protein n=1 Tax=Trachymyrmex septentrionalis TaxID=34720 RepID=A0A195FSQ0_9HYME|nr:hypothetical protein ALC56_02275 [Trachymyrmex septentrionalis]